MKVNIFMPKYMAEFKCISSSCTDTCCAGWDINIDEDTYNKYKNSTGDFNKLLDGKYVGNKDEHDSFNQGFMVLKEKSRCPFLNCNMLCDIHGGFGEEELCITCKSYPRVFNIVDDVYEKNGLPSCPEICAMAFLNKDKMEFIEGEEELEEKDTEIRRIIDSAAFDGTDSLLQYFWDIRVISINIMQSRNFSIEERLNILKAFYEQIEEAHASSEFDLIEELLEEFNDEESDYSRLRGLKFKEDNKFYTDIAESALVENIRSVRLKECLKDYINGMTKVNNMSEFLNHTPKYFKELESYSYVFENYLVNQIFKDLIPFNKGESLVKSVNVLINSYRIIKAYIIGIAMSNKEEIKGEQIVRVIQALSKDIEHNKVFKELLER
ncbi:flagellin lysine-N-methylase [Clostridium chromiireducens]|uniref:Flagellar biosynthetic protein FliU n=1 Tax=Clostridium chromiireducens TaxID=225345 RepID=A0A1V4IJY9_9CLOT|nr:flagellin lysine-N-methylase [Clostridium chromiireducens]OPJ60342.1 flagellar biosynthetic protein FliU [Clostridium chromiireducens]